MARSLAEAALSYAARGWPVFPLVERGKVPLTAGGFKDATTKAHIVADMWRRHPNANIGLWPRGAGFCVIDIDGPEGEAEAQRLGLLAEPTLTALSGRTEGGRHLYFAAPAEKITNDDLAEHLNVRCDNGYVVTPPSIHPTGTPYRWLGTVGDILPLPAHVLTRLRETGERRSPDPVPETIGQGARNRTLFRLGCAWRRLGASEAVILAGLEAANATACQPPLDDRELRLIAASAARYAPAAPAESKPASSALPGSWGAP